MSSKDESPKMASRNPLDNAKSKRDTVISLGSLSHTSPRVGSITPLVQAKVDVWGREGAWRVGREKANG